MNQVETRDKKDFEHNIIITPHDEITQVSSNQETSKLILKGCDHQKYLERDGGKGVFRLNLGLDALVVRRPCWRSARNWHQEFNTLGFLISLVGLASADLGGGEDDVIVVVAVEKEVLRLFLGPCRTGSEVPLAPP